MEGRQLMSSRTRRHGALGEPKGVNNISRVRLRLPTSLKPDGTHIN